LAYSPGHVGRFRLIPKLIFSANSPPPHSAPNVSTSPCYKNPFVIAPNAYPGPPGIIGPHAAKHLPQTLGTYGYKGGGDYFLYNSSAVLPDIPAADRQSFYGSFTRDICDKYLTMFADFKYTRSFFDLAGAATGFAPDPFKQPNGDAFSPNGISVPIANPFNPFTVADTTLPDGTPVTTGVGFRGINDTGGATAKTTFHDIL